MKTLSRLACGGAVAALATLAGCEGRPSLFPNSDSALNKTSTQFAADAARRFPYPVTAPHPGDAQGRASLDHMFAQLQILNSDNEDWSNIDVWVNKTYVCHIPRIPKGKEKVETLNYGMLYDQKGRSFDSDGGKNPMKQVEIFRDGKVFNVPLVLAD